MKQYAEGAAFVRTVVARAGMAASTGSGRRPTPCPPRRRSRTRRLDHPRPRTRRSRSRPGDGARNRVDHRDTAARVRRQPPRPPGRAVGAPSAATPRAAGPARRAVWCSWPAAAAPTRSRWPPRSGSSPPGSGCALRASPWTTDCRTGSPSAPTTVAALLRNLGLDPGERVSVTVGTAGGPEAAARAPGTRRWRSRRRARAAAVLLGHTRDDQAETVLLGLASGPGRVTVGDGHRAPAATGGRSWTLARRTVHGGVRGMGLEPWDDPHNTDPAYTRVRVRHGCCPCWKASGAGGRRGARADRRPCRDDADALDAWADQAQQQVGRGPTALDAAGLEGLPRAIRTRLLRRIALAAGCPAGALRGARLRGGPAGHRVAGAEPRGPSRSPAGP